LGQFEVPWHSDVLVVLQRLVEQYPRASEIAGRSPIYQHHRVEAAYLRLFHAMGYDLRVSHRALKMRAEKRLVWTRLWSAGTGNGNALCEV
jgi:hypothetical protein